MRRAAIRPLLPGLGGWLPVPPADAEAKALFLRHRLSWLGRSGLENGTITRPTSTGLTLVSPGGDALCAWKPEFIIGGGEAVRLIAFHNESRRRAYRMLGEAGEHALERFPGHLPYVIIDRRAAATRTKTLIKAGWTRSPHRLHDLQVWTGQRSR